MKKLAFLFVLSLCSLAAWAYDFSAVAPTGQTLYYNITSSTSPYTVSVTCPGHSFPYWSGYAEPAGSLTIPSTVTHSGTTFSVTAIGYNAFNWCTRLTSVTIPNSVTSIDNWAFYLCSGMASVTIPNSVTSIGSHAFSDCRSLTSVAIPNSVTFIGDTAFTFCSSLTSVIIPNSVTSIGNYTFYGCSHLTSVIIPNSVTTIGFQAFQGCSSLTSVIIPNSVTSIGKQAFDRCSNLTSVAIGKSVTSIGMHAFEYCGLTSVTIPNSVTSIAEGAFMHCNSLTSVTIGNSVSSIPLNAFIGCSSLTSVTIGNSVSFIGNYAFCECSGLTSVTIPNSVTSIDGHAFSNCSNLRTVYNLSNLNITKGSYDNGYVSRYATRVLSAANNDFTNYGSGKNAMHKLSNDYMVVDVEDGIENHIPKASIPANFIYKGHGNAKDDMWRATEIILTDGEDGFEAPVNFVADVATYTREFVNGNRSTLYLPFSAPVPEGFEVYDFANFDNSTLTFSNHTGDIAAYTPYLVGYDLSKDGEATLCTIEQTIAFFPASTPANYHPVTRNGMTFSGVIERTQMYSSNNYGYTNGSFVHSNGTAHVNPFRSFFTYDAPVGAPAPASVLNIEFGDPVSIYDVEPAAQQYDGRYGNDVFDMMGRIVRKNADNLNGLPRGIYIWKGKKVFANN